VFEIHLYGRKKCTLILIFSVKTFTGMVVLTASHGRTLASRYIYSPSEEALTLSRALAGINKLDTTEINTIEVGSS
jgi:hypothetical protein